MNHDLLVMDSDFYSTVVSNDLKARSLIQNSIDIAFPLIVIGELLCGFRSGNRYDKNYAELKAFLSRPSCRILIPSYETAEIYGKLHSELRSLGKMIPTNDLWIAALTIEYEATLATFDKHFKGLNKLQLAIG